MEDSQMSKKKKNISKKGFPTIAVNSSYLKQQKSRKNWFWNTRRTLTEKFNQLTQGELLARLYKHYEKFGRRQFLLRSIITFGLDDPFIKDCRLL